jgi:hypothetical protein
MAYLSLSSVMAEMNSEESRARQMLDLSPLNLPPMYEQEEPEPVLKEKPTEQTPLAELLGLLGGGKQ